MSPNARSASDPSKAAASPREAQPWLQARAGFLRAVLLILAYCLAVISLIGGIAFRGINGVSMITGALCIVAVVVIFLLPSSRRVSQ